MAGALWRRWFKEIPYSLAGSEPEKDGAGLCGYFLSSSSGSGDPAGGDGGDSGGLRGGGEGAVCGDIQL